MSAAARVLGRLAGLAGFDLRRVGVDWLLARRGVPRLGRAMVMERFAFEAQMQHLLALRQVDLVLDVGASGGSFASGLRDGGFRGHIVSFEPVPEAFTELSSRTRDDARWTALPYALGERDGIAPLQVAAGTQLSSLRSLNACGRRRFGAQAAPVRVV